METYCRVSLLFKKFSMAVEGESLVYRIKEVENCAIPPDKIAPPIGEIAYVEQNDMVEKFTTYEIKGRIFAYIIPYEAVEAETHYEIGVGFQSVYVDEDRNGVFKFRCDEMDLK